MKLSKRKAKQRVEKGCFPFAKKITVRIFRNFHWKRECHANFQGHKFSKISYREVPLHLNFYSAFPKFSVEWFSFKNSNSFQKLVLETA